MCRSQKCPLILGLLLVLGLWLRERSSYSLLISWAITNHMWALKLSYKHLHVISGASTYFNAYSKYMVPPIKILFPMFAFIVRGICFWSETPVSVQWTQLSCKFQSNDLSPKRFPSSPSWRGLQTICLNEFVRRIWILFVLLFAYFRSVFFFLCPGRERDRSSCWWLQPTEGQF